MQNEMQNEMNEAEKILDENLAKLKGCQAEKGRQSCLECEETLRCETRKNYVDSVYAAMDKGGDFDFEA